MEDDHGDKRQRDQADLGTGLANGGGGKQESEIARPSRTGNVHCDARYPRAGANLDQIGLTGRTFHLWPIAPIR